MHQDDIEEAFVVKQILQHLATKHGINFQEMAFKRGKAMLPTFKEDIIDIVRRTGGHFEHVGKTPQSSYKKLAIKKQIEEKQNI